MESQNERNSTPNKSPLVSVIIPAYNVSQYISEALDSILSQDFRDVEIIVVNDGSQDTYELERVLKPYQQSIVYLKHENKGISGARNTALRIARGKYVALLDADDLWLDNKLSEQVTFIQNGGYDLVYADAFLFGDSPWPPGTTFMDKSPSNGEANLESLLALRCCLVVSTVLAKKQAIFDAGMFDEKVRVTEDFDLWIRMALNGNRFGYQREVLAKYRYRADSVSSSRIALHEGALRVLEWAQRRNDLKQSERHALELTASTLRAKLSLERCKLMILQGDFDGARRLLSYRGTQSKSWKVFLARIGLRTGPRLLQKLYRSRESRGLGRKKLVA